MTDDDLKRLQSGDVVRNRHSGESYVVIDGFRGIAVRSVHLSNPHEWLVFKSAPPSVSSNEADNAMALTRGDPTYWATIGGDCIVKRVHVLSGAPMDVRTSEEPLQIRIDQDEEGNRPPVCAGWRFRRDSAYGWEFYNETTGDTHPAGASLAQALASERVVDVVDAMPTAPRASPWRVPMHAMPPWRDPPSPHVFGELVARAEQGQQCVLLIAEDEPVETALRMIEAASDDATGLHVLFSQRRISFTRSGGSVQVARPDCNLSGLAFDYGAASNAVLANISGGVSNAVAGIIQAILSSGNRHAPGGFITGVGIAGVMGESTPEAVVPHADLHAAIRKTKP